MLLWSTFSFRHPLDSFYVFLCAAGEPHSAAVDRVLSIAEVKKVLREVSYKA